MCLACTPSPIHSLDILPSPLVSLKGGKLLEELDEAMATDIPKLLEAMPGLAGTGTTKQSRPAAGVNWEAEESVYK